MIGYWNWILHCSLNVLMVKMQVIFYFQSYFQPFLVRWKNPFGLHSRLELHVNEGGLHLNNDFNGKAIKVNEINNSFYYCSKGFRSD